MNTEVSVSLYSVLTEEAGRFGVFRSYLYDHTSAVNENGIYSSSSEKFQFTIVKTTVTRSIDVSSPGFLGGDIIALNNEVYRLANYQLDRLLSGGIGGILTGTLEEAQELLAETAVHS